MKTIIKLVFILSIMLFSQNSSSEEITECDTKECKQRFKDFKKYARKDIPQATEVLGTFYYKGYGITKNHSKARRYFLNSAKYGSPTAQFKLGLMYLNGEGGDVEVKKGINWLEWAAKNDVIAANYFLGLYYLEGKLIEKDYKKGKAYLETASNEDYHKAQFVLAKYYEVKENNLEKAVEYYKKSAYFIEESNLRLIALGIKSPETDPDLSIERIEVKSESLNDMFDELLAALRYIPAPGKPTGSNVVGMGCRNHDSNCGFIVDPTEIERFIRDMQWQFSDPTLTRAMRPDDL
ncbi:tetratricopeptide repeat protein [Pseudoalteromonas sp. SWN166]|uniref:tetratricopeptide repeat protein n=1 Tax=Pseudoalteromonas sp. SWN166 TaxID=2792061 RepID=UPI0018CD82B6|nr:tetratricopeptide repeat protein [Pseudoalteromonas sp. SWN166]MBH0037613.1 sel1 repeat family protein [Pseudoalteromonas sp. SWN166]